MSIDAEQLESEHALRAEFDAARSRMDGLLQELRSVDDTLEEYSTERQQYAQLREACAALEKLSELGGADLFWAGSALESGPEPHLRTVHGRLDEFDRRVGEIEHARRALLQRIEVEEENAEILEDDLDTARREEELRQQEWVIEREVGPLPASEPVMPWARGGEDDARFRKSLSASLALALLLALLIPWIDLPVPEQWEVIDVSERFTRLLEQDPPVQPPSPRVQPRELIPEERLAEVPNEPVQPEPSAPEPKAVTKPEARTGSKGILAFREKLSGLAADAPAARLGARARIDRSGEAAIGRQGRALVATQVPGASGGIDVASLSRDEVGGGGLEIEGVEVGRAESSIGDASGAERPLSGGPGLGRTDEEIQIVFDRHKSALYRLYNRELRRDPSLQGQMVLRLTIEPDGSVSLCEVQSSDMDAPQLSTRIAGRVQGFDFGAKEGIAAVTILYPIDFLPAT